MSLMDEFREEFVVLNKIISEDYEGGDFNRWEEGAHFNGTLTLDSTLSAQIAYAEKALTSCVLNVSKSFRLDYHDVFRREKDGAIFRITSPDGLRETPGSSTLDINQYKCERWELP